MIRLNPSARRALDGVANLGLVTALVLAASPGLMGAYGRWSQARAVRQFLIGTSRRPALRVAGARLAPARLAAGDFRGRSEADRAVGRGAEKPAGAHSGVDPDAAAPSWGEPPLEGRAAPIDPPSESEPPESAPPISASAISDWEPALLQIPVIGVQAVIREGRDDWRWITGPGHVPGTGLPGLPGNCVVAAHRNMWDAAFARLPRLRRGNRIVVRLSDGERYTYVVDWSREVDIRNRTPLRDSFDPILTMYTCVIPFNPARRWVVRAHLAA